MLYKPASKKRSGTQSPFQLLQSKSTRHQSPHFQSPLFQSPPHVNMEPNWASPGASTAGAPAGAMETVNTGTANAVQSKDRSKCYQSLFSLFLIGLCAAMTTLGVLAILRNIKIENFQEWFIASYMILFSILLFLYEAMWWCSIKSLNRSLRKNFGFIYKIYGKALYLILVACLCIGISKDVLRELDWLRWVTGIAWGATGVFLIVVQVMRPDIFASYMAPTSGILESNPADYAV